VWTRAGFRYLNLVLVKSDAAALSVHGLAVQRVGAAGPDAWVRRAFPDPQSPLTRRAMMRVLSAAIRGTQEAGRAAFDHASCTRVAVTAFANKQVFPLAGELGKELGPPKVCLFVAADRLPDVPQDVLDHVTVATSTNDSPDTSAVVLGTSHKLGACGQRRRFLEHLGSSANAKLPFDVLFVDEAWQLPLHRYTTVEDLAPLSVGVGDVGQLPPIDPSANPWRGDPGYNPYRAWPTAYEDAQTTFVVDLAAVWRPTAAQLPLWRAFYGDWDRLDCVAAPGDLRVDLPPMTGAAAAVWDSVATGNPTLVEIDGLPDPDTADIDPPLLGVVEELLVPLLEGGFTIVSRRYDGVGSPLDEVRTTSDSPPGNPLIVLLGRTDSSGRSRQNHGRPAGQRSNTRSSTLGSRPAR
jgi:hypothetical protein